MKKNLWITLVALVVIVASIFVFVGCKKNGKGVDPGPSDGSELTETDFLTAAQELENPNFIISIYGVSGEETTEIYSKSSSGGDPYDPWDLDEELGEFTSGNAQFEYNHEAFSTTSITGKLFTGDIRSPIAFLGIDDTTIDVTRAKVTIELTGSNNRLNNIQIIYNATFDDIDNMAYKVVITITP